MGAGAPLELTPILRAHLRAGICERLEVEARKRRLTLGTFAMRIIECIVEEDLLRAVLDEEDAPEVVQRRR